MWPNRDRVAVLVVVDPSPRPGSMSKCEVKLERATGVSCHGGRARCLVVERSEEDEAAA